MELRVHKVAQAASGGSHVTIFDADVELVLDSIRVQIDGTYPEDAAPADLEAARQAIQRGAAEALRPHGLGAVIRVARVVIHPVDFKAHQFEHHTADALRRLLSEPHFRA